MAILLGWLKKLKRNIDTSKNRNGELVNNSTAKAGGLSWRGQG